jgi:hypothetical protein
MWEEGVESVFEEDPRVLCVRFSPDGALLAAGCADGTVRLHQANSGRAAGTMRLDADGAAAVRLPTTCVRWRAGGGGRRLLAASAAGTLEAWQAGPGTPKRLHQLCELDNQICAHHPPRAHAPLARPFHHAALTPAAAAAAACACVRVWRTARARADVCEAGCSVCACADACDRAAARATCC